VVPWRALEALIEPRYPRSGRRGRPPIGLSTMLRIHFLRQWYGYSDPAMEDALYEVESMRRFEGAYWCARAYRRGAHGDGDGRQCGGRDGSGEFAAR